MSFFLRIIAVLCVLIAAGVTHRLHQQAQQPTPAPPPDDFALLEALGYVDWTTRLPLEVTPLPVGVQIPKPELVDASYRLIPIRSAREALIFSPDGERVHRITTPVARDPEQDEVAGWQHATLAQNCDLLTIRKNHFVERFDWHGKLLWRRALMAHHDIIEAPSGELLVLTRRLDTLPYGGLDLPIVTDSVVTLSADGTLLHTLDLLPILREHIPKRRLDRLRTLVRRGETPTIEQQELMHTNSVFILNHSIPSIAKVGDLLISLCNTDRIHIVSRDGTQLRWTWGEGELEGQHNARMIKNGQITLFDNGKRRKQSRVLVLDPPSGQILSELDGAEAGFFTATRGAAQQLPGGGWLVTESNQGRVIEMGPEGDVRWIYRSPTNTTGDERAAIYRAEALAPAHVERCLATHP